MLLRYSGSAGGSAVITAALIYGMQLMVATPDTGTAPRPRNQWTVPLRRVENPPPRVVRDPPQPPAPRTSAPASPLLIDPPPGPGTSKLGPGPAPTVPGAFGGDRGPGGSLWDGNSEVLPIARVSPIYPHAARTQGLEGRVVVEFTVTETGTVSDARVIESSDRIFERAALAAVARFRYRPRVIDGTAMAVAGVRTEFAFRLEN